MRMHAMRERTRGLLLAGCGSGNLKLRPESVLRKQGRPRTPASLPAAGASTLKRAMRARFLIAGVCFLLSRPLPATAAWRQADSSQQQTDSGQTGQQDSTQQPNTAKPAKKKPGSKDAKDVPDAPAPQPDAAATPKPDAPQGDATKPDAPNPPTTAPQPNTQQAPSSNSPGSNTSGTPNAPRHSTQEDNPFPEDVSKKAAADGTANPDAADVPKSAAPGDKAAENGSSSRDGMDKMLKDIDKEAGGDAPVNDPARAKEDDRVGKFYFNSGDYPAAYLRFKDAAAADPTDADAVFGLAETARKLNKRDEAVQNYQIYLMADPDGAKAKMAKKALAELTARK